MTIVRSKYEVSRETIGILKPQEVNVVHMSRERFLEIVNDTLAHDPVYQPIAAQMRVTATEMDRFPLGRWLDPTRGCGCVVGEFLVAQHIIDDRAEWLANNNTGDLYVLNVNVLKLLRAQPNGEALATFGSMIDRALRGEVSNANDAVDVIVIDN